MDDVVYLQKPHEHHLQQCLLTFQAPKPRNPSRQRAFILSNDSDEPNVFELRLVLDTHSIIGKGVLISDDDHLRAIDFADAKFKTYSQKLGLRAGKSRLRIDRIELKHNIKLHKLSDKGEVPEARMLLSDGTVLKGTAVPIPCYQSLDDNSSKELYTKRIAISWKEFLEAHRDRRIQHGTVYRGQADSRYVLCPSYFRLNKGGLKSRELRHLDSLSKRFPHLKTHRQLLATAQHLVIPTILLDWTEDPLIAAFFALRGIRDAGATHVSVHTATTSDEYLFEEPNLHSHKMISFFRPTDITDEIAQERIRAQKGLLSYSVLRTMLESVPTPTPLGHVWDIDLASCTGALTDLASLNITNEALGHPFNDSHLD